MALTDTENLYNIALGFLGEYEITEGNTSSKQYTLCSRFYPKARDEVLIAHRWNEAEAMACVMQETTAPLHSYDYKYALPSDCLKVLSIGTDLYDWQVVGGYIVTDYCNTPDEWATTTDYVAGQYVNKDSVTYLCATTHTSAIWADESEYWTSQGDDYSVLDVTYTKQLTTVTSFSTQLYNTIAMKIAIKISTAITNDVTNKKNLLTEYEQLVLPNARSVDSQQGRPRQIYNSSWLRARRGSI
jgi:hypothetical protein